MLMIIEDVFEIPNLGTVLSGRISELQTTKDKKESIEELHKYIKNGDRILVNEETLIVKEVSRNGKLMDPIMYGNNVSILVERIQKEKEMYVNQKVVRI